MYNNPNQEELTQHEKIFVVMLRYFKRTGEARYWRASDFQHEYDGIFVGYEATARMSELVKKYPFAFETRMNARFREVKFNFENAREIYNQLPMELARNLVREGIIFMIIKNKIPKRICKKCGGTIKIGQLAFLRGASFVCRNCSKIPINNKS